MADRDQLKLVATPEEWKAWRESARKSHEARPDDDGGAPLGDDEHLLVKGAPCASAAIKSADDLAGFLKGAPDDVVESAVEAFKADEQDGDAPGKGATIGFVISDDSVDRDGDVISPDGWVLEHYQRNPVVLGYHDHRQPVGRGLATYAQEGKVKSAARFNDRDLDQPGFVSGWVMGEMFRRGILHAVSVGFIGLEYSFDEQRAGPFGMPGINFHRQELLEYSGVTVPSNRNALAEARSAGIDVSSLKTWAERILDGEGLVMLPRKRLEAIYDACKDGGRVITFGAVEGDAPDLASLDAVEVSTERLCAALERRGWSVALSAAKSEATSQAGPPPAEEPPSGVTREEARAAIERFAERLDRTFDDSVRTAKTALTGRLPD